MIILRDCQEKSMTDIRAQFLRGCRRVCFASPTGSGKGILFVELTLDRWVRKSVDGEYAASEAQAERGRWMLGLGQ
jgi:hypothetical protein